MAKKLILGYYYVRPIKYDEYHSALLGWVVMATSANSACSSVGEKFDNGVGGEFEGWELTATEVLWDGNVCELV